MEQLIGKGVPWGGEMRPDDKTYAMIAHLSPLIIALISGGLLSFVGPLIIWAIRKAESPYVANQALQALFFSLVGFVVGAICTVLTCCTGGIGAIVAIPLGLLYFVYYVVVVVMATIKTSEGLAYEYPFVAQFAR